MCIRDRLRAIEAFKADPLEFARKCRKRWSGGARGFYFVYGWLISQRVGECVLSPDNIAVAADRDRKHITKRSCLDDGCMAVAAVEAAIATAMDKSRALLHRIGDGPVSYTHLRTAPTRVHAGSSDSFEEGFHARWSFLRSCE